MLVTGVGALADIGQSLTGQAAILLATISSAVAALHGRHFAALPPEVTATGTLTFAAVILVPFSLIFETPLQLTPSAASVAALVVNAIVATALGFVLYFRLIRAIGSMTTASVGYLKPAVGALTGCFLLGETLTWGSVIGLLLILLGVAGIGKRLPFSGPPRPTSGLSTRAAAASK
jgi:drug/metabolite transporter (DMT)-like permease